MLVLSRRKHEAIYIGEGIAITVRDILSEGALLRYETPPGIKGLPEYVKAGAVIQITPEITVQVLEVGTRAVRLGFTAPEELTIVRHELLPDRDPRRLMTPYVMSKGRVCAGFLRGGKIHHVA